MTARKKPWYANPHLYTILGSFGLVLAGEWFPKVPYEIYGQKFSSNLTQIIAAMSCLVFVLLPALARLAIIRAILAKFGINIKEQGQ